MKIPRVSVLMSVYNGEKYLSEAMDSILEQTYKNWEFIIIDDCSADGTADILSAYARRDPRIRVYRNERNLRLPGSLNRALAFAQGEYIVRMDADDISRRDRIEKQVAFMEQHPGIALSGSRAMTLTGNRAMPTNLHSRNDAEGVAARFLFFNPVIHPAMIARRKDLISFGYRDDFFCTEDFDLWIRMLCNGKKLAVQEDYLLLYRQHENQITVTATADQKDQSQTIIQRYYQEKLYQLDAGQTKFWSEGIYYRDRPDLQKLSAFLMQIRRVNAKRNSFSKRALECAAFDLFMAYRTLPGQDKKEMIRKLRMFSPWFLGTELVRRKKAARKALRDSEEARIKFGLVPDGDQMIHGIPCYIKK